jgi:hypothetical protein
MFTEIDSCKPDGPAANGPVKADSVLYRVLEYIAREIAKDVTAKSSASPPPRASQ